MGERVMDSVWIENLKVGTHLQSLPHQGRWQVRFPELYAHGHVTTWIMLYPRESLSSAVWTDGVSRWTAEQIFWDQKHNGNQPSSSLPPLISVLTLLICYTYDLFRRPTSFSLAPKPSTLASTELCCPSWPPSITKENKWRYTELEPG